MGGGQELVLPVAELQINGRATPAAATTAPAATPATAAAPARRLTLTASAEYAEVAATTAEELLAVATIQAAALDGVVVRPNVDIVCVIDRSGSMAGSKIDLTRTALKFVVSQLRASDRLSVISYDTDVRADLPLTAMTPANQARATQCINALAAGASTNLSGGLFRGLDEVAARAAPNPVCSVLLMTDGEANYGIVEPQSLLSALRTQLNRAGVEGVCTIYTFGYGSDHNAPLLRSIADAGRGIYYYVDRPSVVPQSFGTCIGGLTSIVGNRLSLRVTALGGARIMRVLGADDGTVDGAMPGTTFTVRLGDISAEEQRDVVFRVHLPVVAQAGTQAGTPSSDSSESSAAAAAAVATAVLTYTDLLTNAECEVAATLTVARPAALPRGPRERNQLVEDQRLRIEAVEAMEAARALAERGEHARAQARLQSASTTIMSAGTYTSSPYQQALAQQMNDSIGLVSSAVQYQQEGSKVLSARAQSNRLQRTTYDSRAEVTEGANDGDSMSSNRWGQMYSTGAQSRSSTQSAAFARSTSLASAQLPPPPLPTSTTQGSSSAAYRASPSAASIVNATQAAAGPAEPGQRRISMLMRGSGSSRRNWPWKKSPSSADLSNAAAAPPDSPPDADSDDA